METKNRILQQICFNERNIGIIVGLICQQVKLSDRSVPKLIKMIEDCMKKNMKRLNRDPTTKDEIKEVVRNLNRYCVEEIINIISKKYPEAFGGTKKNVGKMQLKRDMDVYGQRDVQIVERPHIVSKKDNREEENPLDAMFAGMNPNEMGHNPSDFNSYASPFEEHSITGGANLKTVSSSQDRFMPESNNKEDFSKRYEMFKSERDSFMGSQAPKIPEVDFSLDDPETKARKKMEREQNNKNMENLQGNDTMNGNIGGGIEDYYSSILGSGAPPLNDSVQTNMTGLGSGNPVMASSSHSIQDNHSKINGSIGGNQDYEKLLESRRKDDEIIGIVKPPMSIQPHSQPQQHLFSQSLQSQPQYQSNNIFAGI